MKQLLLISIFIGLINVAYTQQKSKPDIWSGTYVMRSYNSNATAGDTLIIEKTADASADKIPDKYKSDLTRWTVTSKKNTTADQIVRRFLFDAEENENQYKEFGWTDLYKSGKIECIDGGLFFICQTTPNTVVKFNKEESYSTKTGMLAVWLHHGLFELERIETGTLAPPAIGAYIRGDFNGDGKTDFAKAVKVKEGQGNPAEDGVADEYEIQFSGNNLKPIKAGCCDIRLINEGDLNNDGTGELSIFQAPMNGCTYTMKTYSIVNKMWVSLNAFLVSTGCDSISNGDLQKLIFMEDHSIYYLEKDTNDDAGKLIKKKIK